MYKSILFEHFSDKKIGHFTAMSQAVTPAIGCAMVHHKKGKFKRNYFVCNYGQTNVVGKSVYIVGKAGSKCDSKKKGYNALCN